MIWNHHSLPRCFVKSFNLLEQKNQDYVGRFGVTFFFGWQEPGHLITHSTLAPQARQRGL